LWRKPRKNRNLLKNKKILIKKSQSSKLQRHLLRETNKISTHLPATDLPRL